MANNQRGKSLACVIKLPDDGLEDDRGYLDCCYENQVFYDFGLIDFDFRNDFTGSFARRQDPADLYVFTLTHVQTATVLDLSTGLYGQYFPFGSFIANPDVIGVVVDWNSVKDVSGLEGVFRLEVSWTVAGIAGTTFKGYYKLDEFSYDRADGTVRIDVTMDGYNEKLDIDFTGVGFRDSVRVPGYFGYPKDTIETENLVLQNRDQKQIKKTLNQEFQLEVNPVPSCVAREVVETILTAPNIQISDYNRSNPSYDYKLFDVTLLELGDNSYFSGSRQSGVSATFSPRFLNNRFLR